MRSCRRCSASVTRRKSAPEPSPPNIFDFRFSSFDFKSTIENQKSKITMAALSAAASPSDPWPDLLRQMLRSYDETLLRKVAGALCRPRSHWPVAELID